MEDGGGQEQRMGKDSYEDRTGGKVLEERKGGLEGICIRKARMGKRGGYRDQCKGREEGKGQGRGGKGVRREGTVREAGRERGRGEWKGRSEGRYGRNEGNEGME